jgi:hypothetical protein
MYLLTLIGACRGRVEHQAYWRCHGELCSVKRTQAANRWLNLIAMKPAAIDAAFD